MKMDNRLRVSLPLVGAGFSPSDIKAFARSHRISETVAAVILVSAGNVEDGARAVAKMRGR